MRQHLYRTGLRRRWLGIAAGLVIAFQASLGPAMAAEIASRPVAFRAPGRADQARAWGAFAFGMVPAEAHHAALRMGGQLVPAVGASTTIVPRELV